MSEPSPETLNKILNPRKNYLIHLKRNNQYIANNRKSEWRIETKVSTVARRRNQIRKYRKLTRPIING